jgi:hypothetical protein
MDKYKRNKKRYYLHYKIRKQGYKLVTKLKTVYVPYTQELFSKQLLVLTKDFGYCVQKTMEV